MKPLVTIISVSLLLLSLPVSARLNVLTCEPEWKALAEQIGGEQVIVSSATTAFQDPHYIEARPSLIAKTRRADLLVCTGAELEVGWLPLLLRQSGNAAIQADAPGFFMAAEQVERIEIPQQIDRRDGDVHASGNPHVHWDPYRLLSIARALADRLAIIDRDHADYYQQRYLDFAQQWNQHIERWEVLAMPLKGTKAIVHHRIWSYLLDWLGIEVVGNLEPKPGLPPTSSHLASLLETVESTGITYILIANYQNDKGAKWLSKKTNIPVVNLPFTVGGNENSTDLVPLYDEVLGSLTKVRVSE